MLVLNKTSLLAVIALLVIIPAPAFAEMSVNGFFPSDYVRTDVFDGNQQDQDTEIFTSSQATAARVAAKNQASNPSAGKIIKVRAHSGRFAKTTKGTHRSSVQQSEWDVSPIIPSR